MAKTFPSYSKLHTLQKLLVPHQEPRFVLTRHVLQEEKEQAFRLACTHTVRCISPCHFELPVLAALVQRKLNSQPGGKAQKTVGKRQEVSSYQPRVRGEPVRVEITKWINK